MKKISFLFFLSVTALVSFAGENNTKAEKPQVTMQNTGSNIALRECATAVTTYQGVTIVCYRCAETLGGPNGAEAKAADCLMDAMMEMQQP